MIAPREYPMVIEAEGKTFAALNSEVRACEDSEILIKNCVGQRYIAAGLSKKSLAIEGTPGNALGAYLNGAKILLRGNAQEATGDTMNGGEIVVCGNAGDATGYAMRGGEIFVRGDVGYRCGIHMKAYKEHKPAIVVGGSAGSFLGEYQAGGILIVLGKNVKGSPVGNFCGTGMHGGEIYLRCNALPKLLPAQVKAERLESLPEGKVKSLVQKWCELFKEQESEFLNSSYFRLIPNSENPYKQMYTVN